MTYRKMLMPAVTAVGLLAAGAFAAPDFGPNVIVLDPSMHDAQQKVDAIFVTQESGQFNENRYAVLMKPGHYNLDVQVGFYTQVMGLGRSPDDVDVSGAVRSTAGWMDGNATCNFWRSAENLSISPKNRKPNVWAVSQATALRRVHVKGELDLWDRGWSSGGFMADCRVDGAVVSGSQQQWISRNCDWRQWRGGVFNMVFVGTPNAPEGGWPAKPYTTIPATPVVREKPYLTMNTNGGYAVVVPGLRQNARGASRPTDPAGRTIGLDSFYIAHADKDDAASMNTALDSGKHLLLTPGIYKITAALHVSRPGTVVMALGYATLQPTHGTAAINVDDVDGVTLSGLLLDAGEADSPELLQIGQPGSANDHAKDPTAVIDLACRAGGAAVGKCHTFVTINSKNVIGDNFWLWRADHGAGAGWAQNTVANGLVVNGDDVTIYGLFVEHTQQYQTLWNGNGGRVYMYQSEFPYDPPAQAAWGNEGRGYASYKVADNVATHEAYGLGVYCIFLQAPVVAQNAIETPTATGIRMTNMTTQRFTGQPGSGVAHVINGRGGEAITSKAAHVE